MSYVKKLTDHVHNRRASKIKLNRYIDCQYNSS